MYTNTYMHLYFLKKNILEANNITTMQNCMKDAMSTINNNLLNYKVDQRTNSLKRHEATNI